MHVLLTLAGVIGAFGYWFFILRRAGDAAGQVAEAAGRARGRLPAAPVPQQGPRPRASRRSTIRARQPPWWFMPSRRKAAR